MQCAFYLEVVGILALNTNCQKWGKGAFGSGEEGIPLEVILFYFIPYTLNINGGIKVAGLEGGGDELPSFISCHRHEFPFSPSRP